MFDIENAKLVEKKMILALTTCKPTELVEYSRIVKLENMLYPLNAIIFSALLNSRIQGKDIFLELQQTSKEAYDYFSSFALEYMDDYFYAGLHKQHWLEEWDKQVRLFKLWNATKDAQIKIGKCDEVEEISSKLSKELRDLEIVNEDESIDSLMERFEITTEENKKKYEESIRNGLSGTIGIATWMKEIDAITNGIQEGHYWVVGGYTSAGKTFFMLNMVAGLVKQKKRCFIVSLEMTSNQIIARMLAILSGVDVSKIEKKFFTEEEEILVQEAKSILIESKISITSTISDIDKILYEIYYQNLRAKVDCVFVDYLQLVRSTGKNYFENQTIISPKIQTFCVQNKIPIVCLSQVSNEHAKMSIGSDMIGFKGSGEIAASADIALELYSTMTQEERSYAFEKKMPTDISANIKKNRHGRTGQIDFEFTGWNGQFKEKNSVAKNNTAKTINKNQNINAFV